LSGPPPRVHFLARSPAAGVTDQPGRGMLSCALSACRQRHRALRRANARACQCLRGLTVLTQFLRSSYTVLMPFKVAGVRCATSRWRAYSRRRGAAWPEPHRVLNVPVPEIVLDRPRVVAVVGELVAAGVAQHGLAGHGAPVSSVAARPQHLASVRSRCARRRRRRPRRSRSWPEVRPGMRRPPQSPKARPRG
jgi:hypothetical protein